mmetsp:Transcript_11915/g.17987  ORF Transcript_11915/g.17987 Transcript_11915/m.17987 type:complete len:239 (+) Transcript_11915:57-773(+)
MADSWTLGAYQNTADIRPDFDNLKEEVLKNSFHPITQRQWNNIFLKTNDIYNCKLGSKERLKFSRILRANKIKFKHILAIKLYTDHIDLQREFKKCFYPSGDDNLDERRCREFYHWNNELRQAISALSKIECMLPNLGACPEIYRGVKCNDVTNQSLIRKKTTFDGPMSCTTSKSVAREFAGERGVVLVIQPHAPAVDLSLISGFSQEKEVLLFDHEITVKDVIKSPRNHELVLQKTG